MEHSFTAALNARDLERLARLLAVAGSTAHDGEAATAVRMADKLLKSRGESWETLLQPVTAASPPSSSWHRHWCNHAEAAWNLLRSASHVLTEWEIGFLKSIMGRRRLTASQLDVLDQISRKADTATS